MDGIGSRQHATASGFRGHWLALAAVIATYLGLFAYYYPRTHGIYDEVGFLNQALVWSKGSISAEGAGFGDLAGGFLERNGRHVCRRNPGQSLLLLPFFMLDRTSDIFWTGAAAHVLLTGVVALILAKLGVSPLWALLVLSHPTLALYSRTVMADGPAAAILALAFLGVVGSRQPGLWAGLAVGVAALFRYQVGVILPFLAAAIRFSPKMPAARRHAWWCLAAGGAVGVLIAGYNLALFGNPVGSESAGFSLSSVPAQAWFHASALLLLWPGLLFAPFIDRTADRWLIRAFCLPFLALLLTWFFHDERPSVLETAVVGQRLLQPVLPLWILCYAILLNRALVRWIRPHLSRAFSIGAMTAACAASIVLMGLIFARHHAYLADLESVRNQVAATVPQGSLVVANFTLRKLFAVPSGELPEYRWANYDFHGVPIDHSAQLEEERGRWYLALLPKTPGAELPEIIHAYVQRYGMKRVPISHPKLMLYACDPRGTA